MNKHQPPEVWLRRVRAVFFCFCVGVQSNRFGFPGAHVFFFVFWRPVGAGLFARFSDLEVYVERFWGLVCMLALLLGVAGHVFSGIESLRFSGSRSCRCSWFGSVLRFWGCGFIGHARICKEGK